MFKSARSRRTPRYPDDRPEYIFKSAIVLVAIYAAAGFIAWLVFA